MLKGAYFLNTVYNGFIANNMTTAIIHKTSISINFEISAASITPKAMQLRAYRKINSYF